ncbi:MULTISPECIES: DUF397 domain-containing protein [Kitasatospora]|uniref:DUF397 domain-containing protein n=1 Tax=Kitasatospora TaxID=2063 RepID=UPI000C701EDA|nr:DUF397 domain-containing protein [Kitasatospora sp. GP30]MDH6141652.1 hypothetical protein [Kitasatospora sp. GP30]
MDKVDLTTTAWFKSSYSNGSQACVEVGAGLADSVPVRDTKDRQGPALVFRGESWQAFVTGIQAGDFGGNT